MLCFVSAGLSYKAFSLGLVHFTRETLSAVADLEIQIKGIHLWAFANTYEPYFFDDR